ncbi:MAG: hypothetical protein ACJ8FY_04490 [Gemmataceae bacterium]
MSACIVLLAGLSFLSFVYSQADEGPSDPIPLRRVKLTIDDLPREMAKVRQGILLEMAQNAFEEKVRLAARASLATKRGPQLVEAHYRARLEETGLVGTCQWRILHPGTTPAILPLESLNLAIREPRFENQPAVIGDLNGAGLGLLVEEGGSRSVSLNWTARGEQGPSGIRFKLETPACAVAMLELDLPADQVLTEDVGDCQVWSPLPAMAADRRIWKISFADHPKLYLTIRKVEGQGQPAPLLLVDQTTEQRISPESVSADYRFNLLVLHQAVRTLQFHCDPALRPYKVTAPKLEKWELHAAAGGQSSYPSVLTVQLREPLQDGSVKIYCTAPLESPSPSNEKPGRSRLWQSPDIHLLGSIPSGETLKLYLHPDISLEDWEPNGFRLIESKAESNQDGQWPHVLTLKSTGFLNQAGAKGTNPEKVKRPTARFPRQGADFRARTLLWWQQKIGQGQLTAQISCDVVKGSLFRVPVAIPSNWDVERVEVKPAGLLRDWSIQKEGDRSILSAELQQPLVGGDSSGIDSCRLVITLRQAGLPPVPNSTEKNTLWPFPNMQISEARWRESVLAIGWDDQSYEGIVKTTAPSTVPDSDGPWGNQTPKAYFRIAGSGLNGTLDLRPRTSRIDAQCASDVILATGHVAVEGTLNLRAESGLIDTIEVYSSSPIAGKKIWISSGGATGVRSFERSTAKEIGASLSCLGQLHPLHLNNLLSARALGQWWRLTLQHPLRSGEQLALHFAYEADRVNQDGEWEVPLVSIPHAARMNGVATLHLASADRVEVKTKGLEEPLPAMPTNVKARTAFPWRTFRYSVPPASLILRGEIPAAIQPTEPEINRASLTSCLGSAAMVQHFRFETVNWRQSVLPVRLPRDAQVLAIRCDGVWLDRFGGLQGERETDSRILKLPVLALDKIDTGAPASFHQYEVVYTESRSPFKLWDRASVKGPSLPLEPTGFRHFWRLPPGVVPLFDGELIAQPNLSQNVDYVQDRTIAEQDVHRRGKQWAHLFFPDKLIGGSVLAWGHWSDWESRQRDAMARAEIALRAKLEIAPVDATLGTLVEWLAFHSAQETGPLVIDKAALESAELVPRTNIGGLLANGPSDKGLLERIGLSSIPSRFGLLLTTGQVALDRQYGRSATGSPSLSIENGIERAARYGQDRTGQFISVIEWLREGEKFSRSELNSWKEPGKEAATAAGCNPILLMPAEFQAGWTEWEANSFFGTEAEIVIVQEAFVCAAGLILVALPLMIALLVQRARWQIKFSLLLLCLAVSATAYFWLPASLSLLARWPFHAGLAVGSVWFLTLTIRINRATRIRNKKPLAIGFVMSLWLIEMGGNAAPPDETPSNTVYEIPESKDAPNRRLVLASPHLLKRLEELARSGAAAPHGAVILSADYAGKVAARGMEFEAELNIQSFEDRLTTINVPLKGAQVHEDVLLDGARTYPLVEKAPKNGISLKIEGRGLHTVRMHFRVPVEETQDQRDVEFTAPRPAQTRLRLQLPAKALFPQTPTRLGIQRVSNTADGLILQTDLGHASVPIHVRWQQPADQSKAPVVHTREAYLWNLRPGTSSLAARLEFTVNSGLINRVELVLPDPLEVRSVSLETGAQLGGVLGPRLKQWQVVQSDRLRLLTIEFQNPVTGVVPIMLELVPRNGLGSAAILPIPAIHGWPSTLSICAYRLDGLETEIKGLAHLTGMRSRDFVESWKSLGGEEISLPVGAYAIARAPETASFLHLSLRVPTPPLKVAQDLTWRINRTQAVLQGKALLTAPGASLSMVEWQIPEAVIISKVVGRDVWNWSHNGSRLQVWLKKADTKSEVEFSGWSSVHGEVVPTGKDDPRANSSLRFGFELPSIHPLGAQAQTTSIRIVTEQDLALPLLTPNLLPLPTLRQGYSERIYLATKPQYGGRLEFQAIKPRIEIAQTTVADIRDRRLNIVTTMKMQVMRGQSQALKLRLQDGTGMDVRMEGPSLVKYTEEPPHGADRIWNLEFDSNFLSPHRLRLTASVPLVNLPLNVPLPRFSALGDGKVESWVAVEGRELLTESAQGLTAISAASPEELAWKKAWPEEFERLRQSGGAVWKAVSSSWTIRLLLRAHGPASTPMEAILTEQHFAAPDGSHWVHMAHCWLYHETNADLNLSLPMGASITAVALDNQEVGSFRQGSNRLWLPVPGSGISRIWLRWQYAAAAESLEKPRLDQPHMEGVVDGPAVWTGTVPPNIEKDGPADPLAPGRTDLARAEAQARLTSILAESAQRGTPSNTPHLSVAQNRFYRYCRFAEYEINQPAFDGEPFRQARSDLLSRLKALKDRNKLIATTLGFEKIRAEAEELFPIGQKAKSDAPIGLLSDRSLGGAGTPFYAVGDTPTSLPELKLVTVREERTLRAWINSVVIVLALTALWLLSFFPGILRVLSRFWPEVILVVGSVGWFLVGPYPGFALVALFGAGGRLLALGHGAVRLAKRMGTSSLSHEAGSVRP